MQEACEDFEKVIRNEKCEEGHATDIRSIAKRLAVFHIENCKDNLLARALDVVKAMVAYADELER